MNSQVAPPEEHETAKSTMRLSRATAPTAGGPKRERDDNDTQAPKAKKTPSGRKSKSRDAKVKPDQHPPHPAPYFYYTDHSREVDDDPLAPVTALDSVPGFPMKMHAILSMPELVDIIAWDSHGRSFRILRPSVFERDILPKYFDHSKLASFTRQLNGWGFRRLVEGENRGSYYEKYFLRSMPWLCKKMGRPKTGEKLEISRNHSPDLVAISKEHPVSNYPMTREVLVVLETIRKGPKAKVPHWFLEGELLTPSSHAPVASNAGSEPAANPDSRAKPHAQPQVSADAVASAAAQPPTPRRRDVAMNGLLQAFQQNVQATTTPQYMRQVIAAPVPPPSDAALNGFLQALLQSNMPGMLTRNVATGLQPQAHAMPPSDLLNVLLREQIQLELQRSNQAAAMMRPANQFLNNSMLNAQNAPRAPPQGVPNNYMGLNDARFQQLAVMLLPFSHGRG